MPHPPKMKSCTPTSAALWPSLACGPSPLTCGEIHEFDATNVWTILAKNHQVPTTYHINGNGNTIYYKERGVRNFESRWSYPPHDWDKDVFCILETRNHSKQRFPTKKCDAI